MARFKADQVDNYGGQGGTGYFGLRNDKDVATVRFMYNSIDDVEGYAVHEVEVDGRKRWVNCLRDYNQPKDVCPFCMKNRFQSAKLFVPLYNIDEGKCQIWERGKKFVGKISSICARYPDVVSHIFEIERNGASGDMATTYEIYEVGKDDTTLEDLPEPTPILGSAVLDKSAEEMEYYLENGEFPVNDDIPIRRRETSAQQPQRRSAERRTPTNRGDRF